MKNRSWKADEMEMAINFKAMRCAWVFLALSLAVWCISETISSGEIPVVPFVLECVSSIIFFSVKIGLTNRMTNQKEAMMKNRIKELRKAKGLRQEDLAAALGVTRQTIIAIENNKYDPTLELAMRISAFFGVSVNDIFTMERDRAREKTGLFNQHEK